MKSEQLEFWIDFNLPPAMTEWLNENFSVNAKSFFELGFNVLSDHEVFKAAQSTNNVIVLTTKDIDFLYFKSEKDLPKVLYIKKGNIFNQQLKRIMIKAFPQIIKTFTETSQRLIEIAQTL